jgi:hypothetical protein
MCGEDASSHVSARCWWLCCSRLCAGKLLPCRLRRSNSVFAGYLFVGKGPRERHRVQHLSAWLVVLHGLYITTKLCTWQLHCGEPPARVHPMCGWRVSRADRRNRLSGVFCRQLLPTWRAGRASVPWRDVFKCAGPEQREPVPHLPRWQVVLCGFDEADSLLARFDRKCDSQADVRPMRGRHLSALQRSDGVHCVYSWLLLQEWRGGASAVPRWLLRQLDGALQLWPVHTRAPWLLGTLGQ